MSSFVIFSGTREGKVQSQASDSSFLEKTVKYFKHICWCCVPPHLREHPEEEQKIEKKEEVTVINNTEQEQVYVTLYKQW